MGSGPAGRCARTVPLPAPGSGPLTLWSHGPVLSSFKLTAPRRGILGKKHWGLHSREGPSPQLSVSQEHVCLPYKLEVELAWGWVVGMVPGWVMLTRAEEVDGGSPGPACNEHANRVETNSRTCLWLALWPVATAEAILVTSVSPISPRPRTKCFFLPLDIWEHLT